MNGSSSLIVAADQTFWRETSADFQAMIMRWTKELGATQQIDPAWAEDWRKRLMRAALTVFDQFVVLDGGAAKILKDDKDRPVFRVAQQRGYLLAMLNGHSKAGREFFGKLGLTPLAQPSDSKEIAA